MKNTEHFSKFFDLFIALLNVTSKKEGNSMDTFGADLLSTGLPPQEEQVQKVCTDTALIYTIVINHPAEALNGKDPDVSVLGKDQMGNFFHKGV
jgi:hypothetical protein